MSLRVMTWNLWWHFGDWTRRRTAIVDTIRTVEPDVLCLQEVWSDEHTDDAATLADELGLHVARTDPVFWNGQSFGNAILARWPLERVADERLPNAAGEPGHRRIVAARVMTPYGSWPVASTHLDHRFDQSELREAQAREIMRLSLAWRDDPDADLPLIIGADLNAVPDTDEVRMLTGRRDGVTGIVFSDAWEQAGTPGESGATWIADNPHAATSAWPNRRLDYLLVAWPRPKPVGNPIRTWLTGRPGIDGVWPSDHLAVVADLVTP
ncbi:MAG: endonuclease/exonuclease/phosphatase family protein [Ilumatobacter sp.]|uniref:endonuclease/exonuclease/phosphatase family protein n=1 Tax=Ilumatobacter sp. TaxID=1967498 RepID=UPI00391D65A6